MIRLCIITEIVDIIKLAVNLQYSTFIIGSLRIILICLQGLSPVKILTFLVRRVVQQINTKMIRTCPF